jgi:hypothetical protein
VTGDVDEAIFHYVERPFDLIIYILHIHKNDLVEVADVIFQVGEWNRELILCLLHVLKNDFNEFDETMFQGVERHTNSFSIS